SNNERAIRVPPVKCPTAPLLSGKIRAHWCRTCAPARHDGTSDLVTLRRGCEGKCIGMPGRADSGWVQLVPLTLTGLARSAIGASEWAKALAMLFARSSNHSGPLNMPASVTL